MACERYAAALTDHACGALLDHRAARHVRECDSCRATLDAERLRLTAIETDLARLLDVDPSPDFAAKVMTRVASQPARRRVWWPPLAAAAAIVLAVYLRPGAPAPPGRPALIPPPVPIGSPAASGISASSTATPPPAPTRSTRQAARVQARRVATPTPSPAALEVIVPPGQAAAVARLRELARRGVTIDSSTSPSAIAAELTIEPLAIPELLVQDIPGAGGSR